MCGIIGYVTLKPAHKYSNIMAQGLLADTLRGSCGTGIYAYGFKDKEQDVYKRALPGPDFINTSQFDKFVGRSADYNIVIGHNRAATQGSARDINCHPFVFGNIGLVHNGTLRGYHRLVKEAKFSHQVDSAYAAKGMADHGEKETLDQTEGPFVFAWHNKETNTFNLARNNNRDIWWITDKDANTLWFASEWPMLHWLLERNDIDTSGKKFRGLAEHQWLSWDLGKGLKIPRATTFEEYKPVYNRGTDGRFERGWKSRDEVALSNYGLEMYDLIEVKIDKFELYQSGNYGSIEGTAVGPKDAKYNGMAVRIHSISPTMWDSVKGVGKCMARVGYVGQLSWQQEGAGEYLSANSAIPYDEEALKARKPKEASKSTDLTDTFQGPPGVFRSKQDMLEAISGGCCYCGDPIGFEDLGKLSWIEWNSQDTYPVCPTCSGDKDALRDLNSYGRLLRLNG